MDAIAALRISDDPPVAPTGLVRPAMATPDPLQTAISSNTEAGSDSADDTNPQGIATNKKKKKKKSKTAAKLGGEQELAFKSASNAFDHTKDDDIQGFIQNINLLPIIMGAMGQRPDFNVDSVSMAEAQAFADTNRANGSIINALKVHQEKPVPANGEEPEWKKLFGRIMDGNTTTEDKVHMLSYVSDQSRPGKLSMCMLSVGGHDGANDTPAFIVCNNVQRNFLRGHPLFAKALLIEPHITKVPFRIMDIPGRGKGLVATRPIAQGTVFFREPPLYVGPSQQLADFAMKFDTMLERFMHERAKAAYDGLHSCRSKDLQGVSQRFDKLRTNGFPVTLHPPSDEHFFKSSCGVFQTLSRANHSCDPNASFVWSYVNFQGGFQAHRDIAPGEEITVTYVDPGMSRIQRRKELQTKYFFTCTCARCGSA